jgi:hypothetical protein
MTQIHFLWTSVPSVSVFSRRAAMNAENNRLLCVLLGLRVNYYLEL